MHTNTCAHFTGNPLSVFGALLCYIMIISRNKFQARAELYLCAWVMVDVDAFLIEFRVLFAVDLFLVGNDFNKTFGLEVYNVR